jgi:hypothetical protein
MNGIFKLLSVSGSGNNCLYVAAATHLLSLIWTESITGRQLNFLHQSLNSYLGTEIPREQFLALVSDPRNYTDWSLILGVAIRHNLHRNSAIGEFMEQAVVLSEKLWIPKMVAVEIQGDLLASSYKEGNVLREGFMEAISLHNLRAINGVPLIDLAMDKDTLSLYMEGLTDGFNASAHCHYGLLVDPDIFSQHRGFVVHVADPSRISSECLPELTQEGCNDPGFDWTRTEVKERLKAALNLGEPILGDRPPGDTEAQKPLQYQKAKGWFQEALDTLSSMLAAAHRLITAVFMTLLMPVYHRFCRLFYYQNCQEPNVASPPQASSQTKRAIPLPPESFPPPIRPSGEMAP